MPRENAWLSGQAKKMVFNVYNYMKSEADKGEVDNLQQIQKRVAEATNTSISTVRGIIKNAKDPDFVFTSPAKKRPRAKPVTDLNKFEQGFIKRCVNSYYVTNKEVPTVEKIKSKLQAEINYKGSERSLRRMLKDLDFTWKRTQNVPGNRKIPIEKSSVRLERVEYLNQLRKYRQEGRHIIFTGESYVESSPYNWAGETPKKLKKSLSKVQRVVIVHAGSEDNFLPNAMLTFKVESKPGDHSDNITYENYEDWIRTKLVPNIPSNSVVVCGNAAYHTKQEDPAPTANARKSLMQAWLLEKGINYDEDMLKPELYNLIKKHRDQYKKYSLDKILNETNHVVLRLPPKHPDLNPMEMAWPSIKSYISSKNVPWNVHQITKLLQDKVAAMGAGEWQEIYQKVKTIEEEYHQSDHVADMITEEFIISAESESEDEGDEDEEKDEDDLSESE